MTNTNKTFVSPGVYTSEQDLTYVAQSIGVTTLGLVGETLKGPANEPILITNFDEFKSYFGGTSPEKDGNGNPKYELPYIAKSYLEQSNQLLVTRVLGLTGYKPGLTFGIKTLGGVNVDLVTTPTTGSTTLDPENISSSTIYNELNSKTSIDGTSITSYIESNYSGLTNSDNGKWFAIGLIPSAEIDALTGVEMSSPFNGKKVSESNNTKEWYNTFFTQTGGTINGVKSYLFVYSSGSSEFNVKTFTYSASLNTDYDNIVVAALRSRGSYSGNSLNLEVTHTSGLTISSSSLSGNPFADFTMTVNGGEHVFTCNLDSTSKNYISKVLGTSVFEKDKNNFPLYVYEMYGELLSMAYKKGLIRGISTTLLYNEEGERFNTEFDTPTSPMVVSEVRGNKVDDLFQVFTISDGDTANTEVKITIQNIDLDKGEFDIVVRNFNDTDDNMVVLETFTRCSMNPDMPGYVARKIGTTDGEYPLKSKYIMLAMVENHQTDVIPAGFRGFVSDNAFSGSTLGSVLFKTQYYDSGDVIYYDIDGTPVLSSGDKIKKVSLGLSSQVGFDNSLFQFKGKDASGETFGFHLSTNASTITGTTFQTTTYDLEGADKGKLDSIAYRKFTFAVCGGFDGWDIYRNVRTYGDQYVYGKKTYIENNKNNGGVFNPTVGNSDYYAYLKGIQTFSNPDAIDINLFATAGINFYDHASLTTQAIDMIENERADSVYIISAPHFNGDTAQVVDAIDTVSLDSNYSAVYWPWIQIRDNDNSTQLYVPPTGEVLKNIAYTDNVSYPWFASAGYSRGLVNAIKAQKKLTLDEKNSLYASRINPIATFTDTGTIIWGNKTLQIRESALDRLNVRRLLLRTRKLISSVSVRLIFEQNDDQVRNEFLRLVNPILESIKKERGLTDFRVEVSYDPEDIDANTMRGKIFIKPTRSLEYIDIAFILTPTGASFENV